MQVITPLVAGFGVGGLFFPPLILMQAAMPIKDMATTTATTGLIRQLGSTVGVSVGQTIWSSVSHRSTHASFFFADGREQELRKRLSSITTTLDLSSANIAESIRQINTLMVSLSVYGSRVALTVCAALVVEERGPTCIYYEYINDLGR